MAPRREDATPCPFCKPDPESVLAEGELAIAIRDAHPASPGHALLVPRRHVASWFEATEAERVEMLRLADELRRRLDAERAPDGYNLGVNVGAAAGQTVPHLHLHLIPRYAGDVRDPTGGVRLAIPERGNYLCRGSRS